jgi:hypothetical protein
VKGGEVYAVHGTPNGRRPIILSIAGFSRLAAAMQDGKGMMAPAAPSGPIPQPGNEALATYPLPSTPPVATPR